MSEQPRSFEDFEREIVERSLTELDAGRYAGYSIDYLTEVFELVPKHPDDWKMPIDAEVPAGSDINAMSAAIAYFCGSSSEFAPNPDGTFHVTAPGYYLSVVE
jgi:hypothetical protein